MADTSSNRAFLIAAAILGLLAMVLAFAYLQGIAGTERGPQLKILAASRDLPANTALDPTRDLKVVDIPGSFQNLRSRALTPENIAAYKGQRINRPILAEQFVLNADLVESKDIEFSGPLMRALSVGVRGPQAVGGLLVPGDRVKVLVTHPSARARPAGAGGGGAAGPVDASGGWQTDEVVKEPLRVLAVGSRLAKSRQHITVSDSYDARNDTDNVSSVTLEVTDGQAKAILEATGAGQMPVTLLLCPPVSPPASAP